WSFGSPTFAAQRMAELSGLAARSASFLSVHPTYGPWIGLRAAIVFAIAGPPEPLSPARPCSHCSGACQPLFKSVLERSQNPGFAAVRTGWEDWLAVRDACPIGREHRYSDLQVRYHYTHDRALLEQALQTAAPTLSEGPNRLGGDTVES
ncbi:MAG: hypothetical protein AAFS10_00980, partial [Myxococcota bacterium]